MHSKTDLVGRQSDQNDCVERIQKSLISTQLADKKKVEDEFANSPGENQNKNGRDNSMASELQ